MGDSTIKMQMESVEVLIQKLRGGEETLRSDILEQYSGYVMSVITKMTGVTSRSSDEFCIGLLAFNEAIDCYDPEKNASFLHYGALVVNRRIIDYIRKNKKYQVEYPFTYFQSEEDESDGYVHQIQDENAHMFTRNMEIQEELMEFKANLKNYGITLEDLVRLAPKHQDTRQTCVAIAEILMSNKELSEKLERDKKLPIAEILQKYDTSRKILENHRKYIIAIYLVLMSDMEIIKGYVGVLKKGAQVS